MKEKKFEIKAATSHDRIQKNKKIAVFVQFIPASTSVIKKVTTQFLSATFLLLPIAVYNTNGLIEVDNLRAELFIKYVGFTHIKV